MQDGFYGICAFGYHQGSTALRIERSFMVEHNGIGSSFYQEKGEEKDWGVSRKSVALWPNF